MSRTKAINEKCKDCIYDQKAPGTWREQVEACTTRSCALWPYRPISVATVNINRKTKSGDVGIDIDGLVNSLPDDDEVSDALVKVPA